MKLAIALGSLVILSAAAVAQPYDDAALSRQMGFLAGQAVACGLDRDLVARAVTLGIVDAMGYDDEASRGLVTEGLRASQAGGCRPLSEADRRAFEANWAALKRKAGVD